MCRTHASSILPLSQTIFFLTLSNKATMAFSNENIKTITLISKCPFLFSILITRLHLPFETCFWEWQYQSKNKMVIILSFIFMRPEETSSVVELNRTQTLTTQSSHHCQGRFFQITFIYLTHSKHFSWLQQLFGGLEIKSSMNCMSSSSCNTVHVGSCQKLPHRCTEDTGWEESQR